MRASDVQREIDRMVENRTNKMNDTLKQLAGKSNFGHIENDDVVYDHRLETFAELIIYECMEINQQELAFNALTRVRERYEKHFGIDIE